MKKEMDGPALVLLFAGQLEGNDSNAIREANQHVLLYASTPFGRLLLSECHIAFRSELASLSVEDRGRAGITEEDFVGESSPITISASTYLQNSLITTLRLFLWQCLEYLHFITSISGSSPPSACIKTCVQRSSGIGVLAFPTGTLAATAVASSTTVPMFISRAVELFRVAFWIGYRSQSYRTSILSQRPTGSNGESWMVLVEGSSQGQILKAIERFQQTYKEEIFISAVLNDHLIAVSAHPDDLASFSTFIAAFLPYCTIRATSVNSPCNVPHLDSIQKQVQLDIKRRQIIFPKSSDLAIPLRSTRTGTLISDNQQVPLVDQVLEMTLTQPVRWDLAIRHTAGALSGNILPEVVFFGPGHALLGRQLEQACFPQEIKVFNFRNAMSVMSTEEDGDSVAIVGMSIRLPGANHPDALWDLLQAGISTVEQVPSSRFGVSDYTQGNLAGRSMRSSTGNFVNGVGLFDNEFFKISPREAKSMDPQQRLLLHVAHEALEDAGYVPFATPTFDPDSFGVFIGAATNDYIHNLREGIDLHYASGTLSAFLSGRISYAMSMSGPSEVVDTACSSSSVALYHAFRSLQNGDCQAALAGGVNVITSPDIFLGLDAGRFLSHSGQSRPFDADADGYSRGEGCGLFVLKRLKDAIRESDQVLGIIRGIEVNHSGNASSITRTHTPTQISLLRRLLKRARLDPRQINVIEAHAAGTKLGDRNELASVRNVFSDEYISRDPLFLTSIKANIGHLEAASGCASLAKVLLMLRHRTIPRQIGVETLNSVLKAAPSCHIIIPDRSIAWQPSAGTNIRRAIINNYGAAGSNVAILVEDYLPMPVEVDLALDLPYIFGMSAPNSESLESLRNEYVAWLEAAANGPIRNLDFAYTSTARRKVYDYRLSLTLRNNQQDLIRAIQTAPIVKVSNKKTVVVFVFSGQGSHYPGMGSSLYKSCQAFRAQIDACDSILLENGFSSFLPYLLGELNASDGGGLVAVQAAVFALGYALSRLWISWGVMPAVVIGHSLGEYIALVIAEVITLKDAIVLLAERARLMERFCHANTTGMLSVGLDPGLLESIFRSDSRFSDLSIACFNAPNHCTVAGPISRLENLEAHLKRRFDVRTAFLSVPFGYHTSAMQALIDRFTTVTQDIAFSGPALPLASNLTGKVVFPGDDTSFGPSYLPAQCLNPVLFHQGVRSVLEAFDASEDHICWLEIGPHQGILSILQQDSGIPRDALYLGSLKRQEAPWTTLSSSLSRLYLTNIEVKWRNVFSELGDARCVSLPHYPFRTSPFWVEYKDPSKSNEDLPGRVSSAQRVPFLQSWVQYPTDENGYESVFEIPLSRIDDFIAGHKIDTSSLCPASVYLDLALSGVSTVEDHLNYQGPPAVSLRNLVFLQPLVLDEGDHSFTLYLTISSSRNHHYFSLESQLSEPSDDNPDSSILHVRGEFFHQDYNEIQTYFAYCLAFTQSRIDSLKLQTADIDIFLSATIYDVIFPRVVRYSQKYHALERIIVSRNRLDAQGVMTLPNDTFPGQFVIHPVFLDTMVHLAGFVANLQVDQDCAFICIGIGTMTAIPASFQSRTTYNVYCTTTFCSAQNIVLAETTVLALGSTSSPNSIIAKMENIQFRKVPLHTFTIPTSTNPPTPAPASSRVSPVNSPKVYSACRSKRRSSTSSCGTLIHDFSPGMVQESTSRIPDLTGILANILQLPSVNITGSSSLAALGLDSLTSIEVLHTLKTRHNLNLSPSFFQQYSTIQDAQSFIADSYSLSPNLRSPLSISSSPRKAPRNMFRRCIHLLQTSPPGKAPLCLVHDGSGLLASYERLLDLGRDVWAIEDPKFDSAQSWGSLAEMGAFYAEVLLEAISEPVLVGGWSLGGVVAFEMAKQLQIQRPGTVKGVILIDSPSPSDRVYLTEPLIDSILALDTRSTAGFKGSIKRQFLRSAKLLQQYHIEGEGNLDFVLAFLRCNEGLTSPTSVDAPPWLTNRGDLSLIVDGWAKVAGTGTAMRVFDVHGNHFDIFQPSKIQSTSQVISEACEYLEEVGARSQNDHKFP